MAESTRPPRLIAPLGALCWGAASYPILGSGLALAIALVMFIALLLLRSASGTSMNAGRVYLMLAVPGLLVGGAELAARVSTDLGIVRAHSAMTTVLPPGTGDWREAHITADKYRVPDPVLLWRPVASAPYTRQRFKGPVVDVPKPDGVFRVICYGDSNTDGPEHGSWPERLHEQLAGVHGIEVVNAGVAGYTSHQGLLRFREELERYEPDLVLFSFGWNDAASTTGAHDRDYRIPRGLEVDLRRALTRYRWYRVLRTYAPRAEPAGETRTLRPRVPVEHYRENLTALASEAHEVGVAVALLTHPHRDSTAELTALLPRWPSQVLEYNEETRDVARLSGATLIDVQAWFEGNPQCFADACHFNEAGLERMARRLEEALLESSLLP